MSDKFVWSLLVANATAATIFALGLFADDRVDDWRILVRDWVWTKALWLIVLAAFWIVGWIGFRSGAPDVARWIYIVVLALFTQSHVRACKAYLVGVPPPEGSNG